MEKDARIIINTASIKFWSRELNCIEKDLVYALINVGNHAGMVNDFLVLHSLKKESPYETDSTTG